jgi:hypothetical protein
MAEVLKWLQRIAMYCHVLPKPDPIEQALFL